LTGSAPRSPKIALRRPILSGPPDLAVLVRNSKTEVNGRFQRGRHLLWFEPHLLKIRTSRANTLVRPLDQITPYPREINVERLAKPYLGVHQSGRRPISVFLPHAEAPGYRLLGRVPLAAWCRARPRRSG
jgi:hypothetical protein